MPKKSILTDKEAAFLKDLAKAKVEFMIVGLAAATLQGAPVVTQDIDLWIKDLNDPKLHKILKKHRGSIIQPPGLQPPIFVGKNLELFDIVVHMHGLKGFDEEIGRSIKLPLGRTQLRILSLEQIIQSKESLKRPKDLLTLPILREVLLAVQSKTKSKKKLLS